MYLSLVYEVDMEFGTEWYTTVLRRQRMCIDQRSFTALRLYVELDINENRLSIQFFHLPVFKTLLTS